jgi:hypothetical protein
MRARPALVAEGRQMGSEGAVESVGAGSEKRLAKNGEWVVRGIRDVVWLTPSEETRMMVSLEMVSEVRIRDKALEEERLDEDWLRVDDGEVEVWDAEAWLTRVGA